MHAGKQAGRLAGWQAFIYLYITITVRSHAARCIHHRSSCIYSQHGHDEPEHSHVSANNSFIESHNNGEREAGVREGEVGAGGGWRLGSSCVTAGGEKRRRNGS